MTDPVWVKLRDDPRLSWHVVGEEGYTLCGRQTNCPCPITDDLPMDAKSCETCLRIHTRNSEATL